MKDCATPSIIAPVPGKVGAFEVNGLRANLPNSFYVNLASDTVTAETYLMFDGNRMGQMQLLAPPSDLTFGSTFDPSSIATGTELGNLLANLTGACPLLCRKIRVNVTTGQLFVGTLTIYTGSIGGNVNALRLDNSAAVIPSNQQGNVLDFFLPENFVIDGFVSLRIDLPITGTVQTYAITFDIVGVAMLHEMESPCLSPCDVL